MVPHLAHAGEVQVRSVKAVEPAGHLRHVRRGGGVVIADMLILRIRFHYWLARHAPYSMVAMIERGMTNLIAKGASVKPLPRERAMPGFPWLGAARCEDIDCRWGWTVFAPEGINPEVTLVCPACDQEAGVLV